MCFLIIFSTIRTSVIYTQKKAGIGSVFSQISVNSFAIRTRLYIYIENTIRKPASLQYNAFKLFYYKCFIKMNAIGRAANLYFKLTRFDYMLHPDII